MGLEGWEIEPELSPGVALLIFSYRCVWIKSRAGTLGESPKQIRDSRRVVEGRWENKRVVRVFWVGFWSGVGSSRGEGFSRPTWGVSRPTWGSPAQLGDRQGVPPGPSLGTLGVSLGTLGGSLGTLVWFLFFRVVEGRRGSSNAPEKSSHRSALAYFTPWLFFWICMYVMSVCVFSI